MEEFKKDKLREYIENSELRIFNDNMKVRLSTELAKKYDMGLYNDYLEYSNECYDLLQNLNLNYPSNAKPIYYLYIVPFDQYVELLGYPAKFNKGKGGGKPVNCFDLDGFSWAFGISDNLCESFIKEKKGIAYYENEIHELAHLIHSNFFNESSLLKEGIAETIPLYILDLQNKYVDHTEALLDMDESQISTAEELLNEEENNQFGVAELLPNKSCSFRYSYISSYLFVRGCIKKIEEKYSVDKIKGLQMFLEMLYNCRYKSAWRIFDIADFLGLDRIQLLEGKDLQLNVLEDIKCNYENEQLHDVEGRRKTKMKK